MNEYILFHFRELFRSVIKKVWKNISAKGGEKRAHGVCVGMCVCIYVHVYTYVYMCVFIIIYIYIYIYVSAIGRKTTLDYPGWSPLCTACTNTDDNGSDGRSGHTTFHTLSKLLIPFVQST